MYESAGTQTRCNHAACFAADSQKKSIRRFLGEISIRFFDKEEYKREGVLCRCHEARISIRAVLSTGEDIL